MATQIKKIEKKYYPLEEAVKLAVEQNLKRDQRQGLLDDPASEEDLKILEEEVRHLLVTDGENYLPEYPDTEHICVQQ